MSGSYSFRNILWIYIYKRPSQLRYMSSRLYFTHLVRKIVEEQKKGESYKSLLLDLFYLGTTEPTTEKKFR